MKSKEYHLKSRPTGMPGPEHFDLKIVDVPSAGEGEVLVRNQWMSVDPYMRGRMMPQKSYAARYEVGEVMYGGAIGIVEESRAPELPVGTIVRSQLGWREYFVAPEDQVERLPDNLGPAEAHLGALGMPGLTAFVGLFRIAQLQRGDAVFVSAAAGAVGTMVCQFAKSLGCYVVGSAGSDEKCEWLRSTAGVDEAINYRTTKDLDAAVAAAFPKGIDVYFESVGGAHLEAALGCLNPHGRIAVCGLIASYNDIEPSPGPTNFRNVVINSLRVQGFIVSHHYDEYPAFYDFIRPLVETGQVHWQQTVVEGIENAPSAFLGLFSGDNAGKMLVKL